VGLEFGFFLGWDEGDGAQGSTAASRRFLNIGIVLALNSEMLLHPQMSS
jgi:hypothetical protein